MPLTPKVGDWIRCRMWRCDEFEARFALITSPLQGPLQSATILCPYYNCLSYLPGVRRWTCIVFPDEIAEIINDEDEITLLKLAYPELVQEEL